MPKGKKQEAWNELPDRPEERRPVRLNLGAGAEALGADWVNVDMRPGPGVQVEWDLRQAPWPFDDGSVEEIRAFEIIEHLPSLVEFMDECWRILGPGGTLMMRTALAGTSNAWRDPTHVRSYLPDSFEYFDPDKHWHLWGRLYTERYWKVISVAMVGHDAFTVVMEPRK